MKYRLPASTNRKPDSKPNSPRTAEFLEVPGSAHSRWRLFPPIPRSAGSYLTRICNRSGARIGTTSVERPETAGRHRKRRRSRYAAELEQLAELSPACSEEPRTQRTVRLVHSNTGSGRSGVGIVDSRPRSPDHVRRAQPLPARRPERSASTESGFGRAGNVSCAHHPYLRPQSLRSF